MTMETFQWVPMKFLSFCDTLQKLIFTRLESLKKKKDKFLDSSDLSKFNAKLR